MQIYMSYFNGLQGIRYIWQQALKNDTNSRPRWQTGRHISQVSLPRYLDVNFLSLAHQLSLINIWKIPIENHYICVKYNILSFKQVEGDTYTDQAEVAIIFTYNITFIRHHSSIIKNILWHITDSLQMANRTYNF